MQGLKLCLLWVLRRPWLAPLGGAALLPLVRNMGRPEQFSYLTLVVAKASLLLAILSVVGLIGAAFFRPEGRAARGLLALLAVASCLSIFSFGARAGNPMLTLLPLAYLALIFLCSAASMAMKFEPISMRAAYFLANLAALFYLGGQYFVLMRAYMGNPTVVEGRPRRRRARLGWIEPKGWR